jgi:hypothetical protein
VLGRRELLHLDADFGQDTLSRSFADARNTDQEGDGLLPAQPRLGGRLLSALLRDGGSVYCSGSSGEAGGISRRIRKGEAEGNFLDQPRPLARQFAQFQLRC